MQLANVRDLKAPLILIYLSFMGCLCVYAVERYLRLPFEPASCLTFMGIIFGIYTLNRFTDTVEDFTNDLGRMLFFQRKQQTFLYLGAASLAASLFWLLWAGKLSWMHYLLLGVGCGYSFHIIPWYGSSGLRWLRIKEMFLLKNLSVSFLWGASVFLVPIFYSRAEGYDHGKIWLLAVGLFVSTLNNTLFDDILDEAGDHVAGIKTLPTMWGGARSIAFLLAVDLAWILAIAGLAIKGRMDSAHAIFLACIGIYPMTYLIPHLRAPHARAWLDVLAEADLLFFTAGMLLLGLR